MRDAPDLSGRVVPGTRLAVRVTPRASRNAMSVGADGTIAVRVAVPPEDGKANAVVTRLLAKALRIAPSRLTLVSGAASRDKSFRID